MATIQFSGRPIVDSQGRATVEFQRIIEDTINTNAALAELSGSADDIADGVTRRIREIAREEIAYNIDGTIESITYKDHETEEVLLTEQVTYMANGAVEKIEATDAANRVTTQTFEYDGSDVLEFVVPSFSGFGI